MAARSVPSDSVSLPIQARELALCGTLGAAALLLPTLAHVLRFWPLFMPMHIPLLSLGFLVRPLPAAVTAALVPIISGAATGMPSFYPPIAIFMCVELATMAGLASILYRVWPRSKRGLAIRVWILTLVMVIGRAVYIGQVYVFSAFVKLPAGFMAGLSFVSGWPGMILMLVAIPSTVGLMEANRPQQLD